MQIDMHYYGIFVLARAAGINEATSHVIATASQFVDDSVEAIKDCVFSDGSRVKQVVTAHHTLSKANTSRDNQRYVWVPFHFLPGGGEGENDPLEKRLICRKNSKIAQQMFDHAIASSGKEFGPELIGIASHVFADTFSHCGFSGISSKYNEIKNKSIRVLNMDKFPDHVQKYLGLKLKKGVMEKIREMAKPVMRMVSFLAENASMGLGHGAVMSLPDIPFVKWNFTYEDKRPGFETGEEYNSVRYLQGCGLLFKYFRKYASANPSVIDRTVMKNIKSFADIKKGIEEILRFPGDKGERSRRWQEYYARNKLINPGRGEIPGYDIDRWIGNLEEICGTDKRDAVNIHLYRFYQGAECHRTYVLRELLPAHGIYVI